jgi:hypothetical protein
MTKQADEIAALRAQIEKLEAKFTPTSYPDEAAVARHRDKVHQLNEARATANAMVGFSRGDLAAMRAAAPDDVCRDLARDARAPLTPKGIVPSSCATGNVRAPVNTTGWQNPTPIRNGIGQGK